MHEIIADIYHAAAGTKPWSDPLTRISRHLDVLGCQMVGVSTVHGTILFSHASADISCDGELEYVRAYHGVDPRIPLLLAKPEGEWLYDQDVFGAEIAVSSSYYRDLLIPYGGRHTATSKLFDRDGEVMMIGFASRLGGVGFSKQHRQYLQSIEFHLREAATIYQKVRKLTTVAFAGAELLHRLPRPAWLLGEDRSVAFSNDAAQRYLAEGNTLFLARDRLTALNKQTDDELSAVFQAIAGDIRKGGVPKRRIMRLASRHGDASAALSLTVFVPSESMYAFGTQPQVLILVHERAVQATPDIMLWEAAYNLTPSQARVALEIFQGSTVKEVAEALQIAETTVKSHLGEVYAKTETSRRSQLVLALATLQAS